MPIFQVWQNITAKLGYRVTIANPFLQMGFSPQIDIKIENDASSLMVACGLALRSFD